MTDDAEWAVVYFQAYPRTVTDVGSVCERHSEGGSIGIKLVSRPDDDVLSFAVFEFNDVPDFEGLEVEAVIFSSHIPSPPVFPLVALPEFLLC